MGYVIIGTPSCPACSKLLKLRTMPDYQQSYWYCEDCGDWDTPALIECLVDSEDFENLVEE